MKILIITLVTLLSFNTLASVSVDKSEVDNVGVIHSVELDKYQSITIYLPNGYSVNRKKYPVMYVVDGEKYFLHSIAYQKTLLSESKTPPFIVVGINTEKIKRRGLLGKNAVKFIDTLQSQIVSYVEKNYRTNDMKMYFGWEMAGGFALELMVTQPKLFDAYFLASSTHLTKGRLEAVNHLFESKVPKDIFFYFTLGSVESWSISSHDKLSEIFTQSEKQNLNWQFKLSTSDDHYTTPFDTFNKGLTSYFQDYSPIRFYSLKEFDDFGGIPSLKEHYKKRGEHFQTSTEIHSETKHYLLNQSINENNFVIFEQLVKEFDGFIESFDYSSGFIIKIGRFYADNNAKNKALNLYKTELMKHPEAEELKTERTKLNSQ